MVVTREPEWDDLERDKMLALDEYELGICECGFHRSVADEDPDLEITVRHCPVCAGLAQRHRQIQAEDEKAVKALGESPAPEAERPDDGRLLGLRPKLPPDLARLLQPH